MIIVYMDMIPGNRSCIRIYNDLLQLSRRHSNNVVVLPIVCAEYYMIKSLANTNTFNTSEYKRCISKIPHLASDLMNRADVKRFCKNFEKYCKWILKYDTSIDCIKPFNKETGKNGEYYRIDCATNRNKCNNNDYINYTCRNERIQSKSYELLKAYRFVPSINKDNTDDIWNMHHIIVDEYNKFVNNYIAYIKNSKANIRLIDYKEIKYIK